MKWKILAVLPMLLGASFLGILPYVQTAHAFTNTLVEMGQFQCANACGSGSPPAASWSPGPTTNPGTTGDVLVLQQQCNTVNTQDTSITDNRNDVWSLASRAVGGGTENEFWTAPALTSSTVSVTINWNNGPGTNPGTCQVFIGDASVANQGVGVTDQVTGTHATPMTTIVLTSDSLSYNSNALVITAGVMSASASWAPGCSPANNKPMLPLSQSLPSPRCQGTGDSSNSVEQVMSYYFDSSGGTKTYSYNFTIGSSVGTANYAVQTLVLGSTNTIVVVAPCTFFQLQCWWYPFLFFGLYIGFFMIIGAAGRISPKAALHLVITGLTFGGMVAVILGIMNIVFPLILLLINTLYILRFRGR